MNFIMQLIEGYILSAVRCATICADGSRLTENFTQWTDDIMEFTCIFYNLHRNLSSHVKDIKETPINSHGLIFLEKNEIKEVGGI